MPNEAHKYATILVPQEVHSRLKGLDPRHSKGHRSQGQVAAAKNLTTLLGLFDWLFDRHTSRAPYTPQPSAVICDMELCVCT